MTIASPTDSVAQCSRDPVELAFTLELEPGSPTALLRTLVVLHRRCCRVTKADYRSDVGGGDRLALRVQTPPGHAHCVPAWLSAVIDVRRVTAGIEASRLGSEHQLTA
jgi:hypothetical protein